jgi:hypothetical protein
METYTHLLNDWDDRAYSDDYAVLHEPPEYVLPEWDRSEEQALYNSHDWTFDYDYPDTYSASDEYEEE